MTTLAEAFFRHKGRITPNGDDSMETAGYLSSWRPFLTWAKHETTDVPQNSHCIIVLSDIVANKFWLSIFTKAPMCRTIIHPKTGATSWENVSDVFETVGFTFWYKNTFIGGLYCVITVEFLYRKDSLLISMQSPLAIAFSGCRK